ncbi:MAG: PIF1 helicase [Parcubacteria group bacterium Gr01-1014_18]|nr:MAG: PIF1 helicase [Parcubacteria group bacterium Greene0416_36]TSC81189.1 MAG: PIF1 helicase [Parcubacteria group bacterium Gr01-1014_18]TSC99186.1 MAG: PIF1 helicase [Parcubacteria group bacterium Greene1014_20]TSD07456.1 MAG: PIF1 helicase [Parcubacteria group bacterium Greene0714_2]
MTLAKKMKKEKKARKAKIQAKDSIELNDDFKKAIGMVELGKNLFLTGKAGTGKSTFLKYFREHSKKEMVVLAPTGVAAVNISGQTIHSFFHFKPNILVSKVKKVSDPEMYEKLDLIVIDEISMVRADLLDCVDKFLRLNGKTRKLPFGGVQMVFIGDLYQLPPVVSAEEKKIFALTYLTPYFFSAKVFESLDMEFLELSKVYRQKDADFVRLLNSIRNNSATPADLQILNERYEPDFVPPKKEFYIYLTTTNAAADEINAAALLRLAGKNYSFSSRVSGKFERNALPTTENLELKIGSQIMMLNNEIMGRWVNGTIGQIINFVDEENDAGEKDTAIIVKLNSGEEVVVGRHTWDMFEYVFEKGHVDSRKIGSFNQYPLKLAWAVTIHKSQGKTFDRVIVDIGRGTFAHGQLYVALSRCTSIEGLVLKKPVAKRHIWLDWNVVKFVTQFQYGKSEKLLSLEDKVRMIQEAIDNEKSLKIVYLKGSDEKSCREIIPHRVGEMVYLGKKYIGMQAYCMERKEDRAFRVDRILEMKGVPKM